MICRVSEGNIVINPRMTPAFSVFCTSFIKAASDKIIYSPGHCSLLVWTQSFQFASAMRFGGLSTV